MELRIDAGTETRDTSSARHGKSPKPGQPEPTTPEPIDTVSLPAKLLTAALPKLLPPRASADAPAPRSDEKVVKVRFKPQDDVVPDREIEMPQAQMGSRLDGPRFLTQEDPNAFQPPVADKDGNYLFRVDDPRLGAVNAYVSASKALGVAQKYLGRTVNWGFKRESDPQHLWIHPHAGEGLNAFYNNQNGSINFLYAEDPHTNSLIDSSTSMEVVAHETGHAILDGIRPNYLQSLDVSSGGFHEAFGDTIALLATLQEDDVIEAAYQETGGDLSQPNCISRMGEALGKAMRGEKSPYVRNALNDQKYRDAHFLPFFAFPQGQALEPHAYSQVWSGAVYDVLRVLVSEKMQDSSMTFVDAVKGTRDELGGLVMRSLELAPPGKISYKEAAIAMLKADALDFEGAHLKELLAVFSMRDILTQDDADKFMTDQAMVKVLRDVGDLSLPKDFDPAKDAKANGGAQLLEAKGPMLGLTSDEIKGLKYAGTTVNDKGERILVFNEEKKVILTEPEWGATYQGNTFSIYGGLALAFDADGKLETLTRDPITDDDVANGKLFLRKMIDFEKNPPIVIKKDSDDKDKESGGGDDDLHLEYLLASTKKPVQVVNGEIKRSGIVY